MCGCSDFLAVVGGTSGAASGAAGGDGWDGTKILGFEVSIRKWNDNLNVILMQEVIAAGEHAHVPARNEVTQHFRCC